MRAGADMFFAVLDTNVLVSTRLKPDSVPGCVVAYALAGVITPVINEAIFAEYREVLLRPKFKLEAAVVADFLHALQSASVTVAAGSMDAMQEKMLDPKDAVFYATTLASRAAGKDTYLVTGNLKHFPQERFVVSPRALLDILKPDAQQ